MNKKANHELSRELDQFYTKPVMATSFLEVIRSLISFDVADVLLEPSAGTGSFYQQLDYNKRVGLDLDPQFPGLIKKNFFEWQPNKNQIIYTIGNPPFGKNASLAVKFFNHAAKFSQAIAFILPKTFRKSSVINRLNHNFHLIHDEDVPPYSFLFGGQDYNVWCCAQLWVRQSTPRAKQPIISLSSMADWFEIVDPTLADFAVQRVGGKAGTVKIHDLCRWSKQSHYFIKQKDSRVLGVFQAIDFDQVKFNTAGNPSISPSELSTLWIAEAKKQGIIDFHTMPGNSNNESTLLELFKIDE
jgi:hypothetical protein